MLNASPTELELHIGPVDAALQGVVRAVRQQVCNWTPRILEQAARRRVMSFKIADLIAGVTAGFCAVSLLSTKRRRTRKDGARPDSLNERVRQIAEI